MLFVSAPAYRALAPVPSNPSFRDQAMTAPTIRHLTQLTHHKTTRSIDAENKTQQSKLKAKKEGVGRGVFELLLKAPKPPFPSPIEGQGAMSGKIGLMVRAQGAKRLSHGQDYFT